MSDLAQRAAVHPYPDTLDAIEECYRRGWTDGLPVVPPTSDRVQAMLAAVGLEPDAVLGEVPVRRRALTAEQAAANAVMAGCLPEYFPIVLAVFRVLFEHDPNCIHEVSAVTNSTGVLVIVEWPNPTGDWPELHRQPVQSPATGPTPPSGVPCASSCSTFSSSDPACWTGAAWAV